MRRTRRREAARPGNPDHVDLRAGRAAALTRYGAAADRLTELSGARRRLAVPRPVDAARAGG